jgi:uncharacterized protein with gpF-like domain
MKLTIRSTELTKAQQSSVKAITKYLTKFFKAQGKKIAAAVSNAYGKSGKAAKDSITHARAVVSSSADFGEWDVVGTEIYEDLGAAFEESGGIVLGHLQVDEPDAFSLVNEHSIAYADQQAAELVKGISETTRDRLTTLVSNAIENGQSVAELKSAIIDSGEFSADRAELIARTEIGNAHMAGALDGAKASGFEMTKEWVRGSEEFDCDICGPNEDDGEIPLDDNFSSGDDSPLGHPNCSCDLVFNVATE